MGPIISAFGVTPNLGASLAFMKPLFALGIAICIANSVVTIDVGACETERFGSAVSKMRDRCSRDITAPTVFERHRNTNRYA